MTSESHTANRQPCLHADNGHRSWPTPTVRAETLFLHKTNPTAAPDGLSDGLTTARRWPKPAAQSSPQHTSPTPLAPNSSCQKPHQR
jgi:hypothetical protein